MILKRIDPQVALSPIVMAIAVYFLSHQTLFGRTLLISATMFSSGFALCKLIYWKQIEAAKPPKGPSIFPLFR